MAERLNVGVAARLSRYLQVLTQARKMGKTRISSQEIAEYTNINATQIRRDLSNFGKFGKRGVGYSIELLLDAIRKILRTQGQHNVALVGAGRLGQAIASSSIFAEHGINIAVVVDTDPAKLGQPIGHVSVEPYERLPQLVRDHNVVVGVLAVPAEGAQQAADDLVSAGVKIIFNYSEALLETPSRRDGGNLEPRGRSALRPVFSSDLRVLLWHGYLLGGTGSNVYTRALAREWSLAGHDVTVVCQERHPERYDLGGARVVVPELPGGLLPIFVLDRYEGLEARLLGDFTPEERDAYVEANAAVLRELGPADLVFANHVLLGAPVGAASGMRFRVKAHGSELEYAMRGRPDLARWGAETLAGAEVVVRRLRAHPPRCSRRSSDTSTASRSCRRASTWRSSGPSRARRRSPRCSRRRGTIRRIPATPRSGFPTRATPRASRASSPTSGRRSSTSGS